MLDENKARAHVSLFLPKNIRLPNGDEFVISFYQETESEWIFTFTSKLTIEQREPCFPYGGPMLVGVDKVTGETGYVETLLDYNARPPE